MTVETTGTLSPHVIEKLQDLIQANVDSRDGFQHAAGATEDLTLQSAFEQFAIERDAQANELSTFVAWSGQLPRDEGSMSAVVHRFWLTIREMLSSDDNYAILCELEREEDSIKAAYENVMTDCSGSDVYDVLLREYSAITKAHSRICDLRDACERG